MRLVRFESSGRCGYGVREEGGVRLLAWEPYDGLPGEGELLDEELLTPLAPVVPGKVVAVGLNYRDHAAELGMEIPDEPILFMKCAETVIGHGGTVVYPPQSGRVDYEGELAVVIGATVRNVSEREASDCVLGLTCGLDMTARDLQVKDGQWTRAKNFDTFCPLGPWVDTQAEPWDLGIELKLNGSVKQSSSTSKMIFDVPFLVSFISSVMTLNPGDVILTGTPPGVGEVRPGDEIELSIEGLGTLAVDVGEA